MGHDHYDDEICPRCGQSNIEGLNQGEIEFMLESPDFGWFQQGFCSPVCEAFYLRDQLVRNGMYVKGQGMASKALLLWERHKSGLIDL